MLKERSSLKRDYTVRPDYPKPKTGFPWKEVEGIILGVVKRLEEGKPPGPSGDPEEDPGSVVMQLIAEKWMNGSPMKTIDVQKWAAERYFRILVVDQYRCGSFRDHGRVKTEQ